MTVQTAIVIAVVAACALAMGLRAIRTFRGSKKTGCGCAECPAVKPSERHVA
jgi:hypothetical protein